MDTKIKIKEQVGKSAFIAFAISVIWFLISNADMLLSEPRWVMWGIGSNIIMYIVKVSGNSIISALLIFFGIKNEGVVHLIGSIVQALSDGRLTAQEKLEIITIAKDTFLGIYADLAYSVQLQKEKKEKIEPLE